MSRKLIVSGHLCCCQTGVLRPVEVHVRSDTVTCTAEKITPLFLEETNWLTNVFPAVIVNLLLPQHLGVCFNPHVLFSFWSCDGGPMSRLVSSGSTEGTGWTFRPGTWRWRLICDVMVTFSYLVFVPDDPFDDRPQAFVLVVHFFCL